MSQTELVTSHSEKEIVENCIHLMQNLTDRFQNYLEFMDIKPDTDEEIFSTNYSYFEIVQRLLLSGTTHSGGTSTMRKCKELGFDSSDIVSFCCEEDTNDSDY